MVGCWEWLQGTTRSWFTPSKISQSRMLKGIQTCCIWMGKNLLASITKTEAGSVYLDFENIINLNEYLI